MGWRSSSRSSWLIDYAGAEDTQYIRAVSSKFIISAIARALDPGCKVDTMLILEGPQGKFKSMLLRALAGGKEYFSDNLPDLQSKDAMDHIRGPWIIEIKELEAFNKTRTTAIKGWLDCQDDRFRPAYGSKTIDFPRRCVFAGTTNSKTYLKDPTGNRRFWPVWITSASSRRSNWSVTRSSPRPSTATGRARSGGSTRTRFSSLARSRRSARRKRTSGPR